MVAGCGEGRGVVVVAMMASFIELVCRGVSACAVQDYTSFGPTTLRHGRLQFLVLGFTPSPPGCIFFFGLSLLTFACLCACVFPGYLPFLFTRSRSSVLKT